MLVETYQHMVFRTALDIVQQDQEAEDVAQEVFIEIYRSVKNFRGEAKLSTWIYQVTLTRSFNHERKKRAAKRFSFKKMLGLDEKVEQEAKDFFHPGVLSEKREDAAVLFRALKNLPENQLTAFVLIRMEGLSYDEAAGVMNVSVKSLEALMHRAKETLRKELGQHFERIANKR